MLYYPFIKSKQISLAFDKEEYTKSVINNLLNENDFNTFKNKYETIDLTKVDIPIYLHSFLNVMMHLKNINLFKKIYEKQIPTFLTIDEFTDLNTFQAIHIFNLAIHDKNELNNFFLLTPFVKIDIKTFQKKFTIDDGFIVFFNFVVKMLKDINKMKMKYYETYDAYSNYENEII